VEILVDNDGNVLIDQHGNPEVKVPNPRVGTFLYILGGMVCHALPISDDSRLHIRRLCTISLEVRALVLTTYLYILH